MLKIQDHFIQEKISASLRFRKAVSTDITTIIEGEDCCSDNCSDSCIRLVKKA